MKLIAVAAVSENGIIGRDGELPWPSMPADKREYRSRIAHDPVILGRRTFLSMVDDLPGSVQIVMSRSARTYEQTNARHARTVNEAFEHLNDLGAERAYVIGGAEIYSLFMPYFDRLFISRVLGTYPGDKAFPDIDQDTWMINSRTPRAGYILEEWIRR